MKIYDNKEYIDNDKKKHYLQKRVDGFLIEMRTRGDRRWRSVPAKNVGSIGERTAFLQSLSPNTLYQVINVRQLFP